MTASTARLDIDDTLCISVSDGGVQLAVHLDRDKAITAATVLLEFAMRPRVPMSSQVRINPNHETVA